MLTGRLGSERNVKLRNSKESNKSSLRPASCRCSRRKGDWLSRPRRKETPSREFSLNRKFRGKRNSSLRKKGNPCSTDTPRRSGNKFSSKKKAPNKPEPNTWRKAE